METPLDDELLETLDIGVALTTSRMARETGTDVKRVANRLQLLVGYGLVRPVGSTFVTLTENGLRYLQGSLDAEDLQAY
jgi:predicted transcriptional regulator